MFIDVHCHLDFFKDLDKLVSDCNKIRVEKIICAGTDKESNRRVLEISKKYNEIEGCLGIYPIDSIKMSEIEINSEIEFIRKNSKAIIGIGEVGLDFKDSPNRTIIEKQKQVFRRFIELSQELDKPLVVHSRKAEVECIELLEDLKAKKVIMHCFSGKKKLIHRIKKNGWFASIPASVKYNKQFQDNVNELDMKNLLCETDSPFLHPNKEENNSPDKVVESYKKIAEIKKISLGEVENMIELNFKNLFF